MIQLILAFILAFILWMILTTYLTYFVKSNKRDVKHTSNTSNTVNHPSILLRSDFTIILKNDFTILGEKLLIIPNIIFNKNINGYEYWGVGIYIDLDDGEYVLDGYDIDVYVNGGGVVDFDISNDSDTVFMENKINELFDEQIKKYNDKLGCNNFNEPNSFEEK